MKKIFILKTGTSLPVLVRRFGDFDAWIIRGMGTQQSDVEVVEVFNGAALPEINRVKGIVISGSHAMITDQPDWISQTAEWIKTAVDKQIPTLGICFGHQLLAYAFGGEVAHNPKGKESGTVPLILTDASREDLLFGNYSSGIAVQTSHSQSVIKLPETAVLLASSQMDRHQAFRINPAAWGVQFHPEFNAEITRTYIDYESGPSADLKQLKYGCRDTPEAASLLSNFYKLIEKRGHPNAPNTVENGNNDVPRPHF